MSATMTKPNNNKAVSTAAKAIIASLLGEEYLAKYDLVLEKPEVEEKEDSVEKVEEPKLEAPKDEAKEVVKINTSMRVPEKVAPISYENATNRTINPTIYINEKGELGVGEIVEAIAEDDEDHHIYDDVDYVDVVETKGFDNSKLLDTYPELKSVESVIRGLDGFDVFFTEEKKLIHASVYINGTLVMGRSFTIDVNGCILNSDCKWFPVIYPSEEAAGYESYPALEMNMDIIKKFVSGEFKDDPSSLKRYSLCSEEELEVNKTFDLSTLPGLSTNKRKNLIKTLSKLLMDPEMVDKLYGFHKRPRFHFKKVDSDKSFIVVSQTGNEYNYGSGNIVKEQFPMEVVYNNGNIQVLSVPEALA